jgi:hypothetical protein
MAIIAFVVIGVQGSRALSQRVPARYGRSRWRSSRSLGATTMARNRDYASGLLLAQSVTATGHPDAARPGQ